MDHRHHNPSPGQRLLGLDFGKYLLSSDKRAPSSDKRAPTMESDNTTGTESDFSDWETNRRYAGNHGMTSETSEDSDEYGIYYGDNQMFDTAIDTGNQLRLGEPGTGSVNDRQNNQVSSIINQLNVSQADSAYSGSSSLYPIHEAISGQGTDSSYEENENSDSTISNSGSPVHNPVYGRYQKLPGQPGTDNSLSPSESTESLDLLTLHRLPGENLGMILGIEGGKDGTGKVSSVSVKSVTLGGAAYRASGSSKGLCVGDEIIQVNNTDLRELMHDECVTVFKDMPLRVLLGIRRGQKDLPAVSISPVRMEALVKKTQQRPVEIVRQREVSDSEEEEGFGGFAVYQVTVVKKPEENLGLSIVPSYGSTKEYYQIKRILPSGAASRSGLLRVGDRLIRCNNTNLRALTQNHCLNIIKAASSQGSVNFEVIRPITDGSSMEISVTLNNNSNFTNFDPQQYSVKSQCYDRNVDVVVTSESEDYLTVSEDEYSQSGRLKNIPAVEANEVFASNSVKLAFQKPFNAVKEETIAEIKTDTDNAHADNRESDQVGVEIVDLNKISSSPYHIRQKQGEIKTNISSSVTNSSSNSAQDHHQRSSDFSVPSSDIDNIGVDINQPPYTDLDYVSGKSTSPRSPRSPLPNTDLDTISVGSPYSTRQQIPSGHQHGVSPPYNYPSNRELTDNPVSDIDDIRYNPLYEDSSVSGTDSEPIALYVASPLDSPEHVQSSDLDKANYSNSYSSRTSFDSGRVRSNVHDNEDRQRGKVSDINGVLPPPFEFSDSQNEDAEDGGRGSYLPVTNIDDIGIYTESSVELSPVHQQIEIIPSEKIPRGQTLDLESSFKELEQVSYVDQDDSDSSAIESDSELTAAFDTVLREQENCVHETDAPVEYAETNDDDILQIIQTRSDGRIIISQFDPSDKRETSDSPTFFDKRFVASTAEGTMDTNSEAMLKNALDMEYDQLPETCKFESRIRLGTNGQEVDQIDVDDPDLGKHNVVSQEIAAEMVRNESGGFGYYMESDDEPDQYPDQDMPEDAPDLPDQPPPELMNLLNAAASKPYALNGVDASKEKETFTKQDPNWSFGVKTEENGDLEIIPRSVQRKVEIPINYLEEISKPKEDNEAIVPTKIRRTFEIPPEFTERIPEQVSAPLEDMLLEPVVTVTTKKSPPRVAPKPSSRNNKGTTIPVGEDSSIEPVMEEVIEAKDARKDKTKNLINVISIVNALKAGVKDNDPDTVDKIVKEDKKDKLRNSIGSVISLNGNKGLEISPPKHEIIVSEKDKIKIKTEVPVEMSPPKDETIVTQKEEIKMKKRLEMPSANEEVTITQKVDIKPSVHKEIESAATKHNVIDTAKQEDKKSTVVQHDIAKQSKTQQNGNAISSPSSIPSVESTTPVMKTTVYVEKPKPKSEQEKNLSIKSSSAKGDNVTRVSPVVPSLDLKSVSSPDSLSPREETAPSPSYKTTIGVKSKPASDKPILAPMPTIKPLSQIKPLSFNPKSLSQSPKPVQYKTTIGTSGTKPMGLSSTLGRLSSLTTKKTDHPIKRMETMPFEVSILKGILGIGIKTAMTAEGCVKVTEILPSGPVGREGNIKVGDFILSINNTQLTGLTDAKVQQILRLLPRGLSKIVASPVPPGQAAPAEQAPAEVPEAEKISSQKSSTLSSPRQPTISATPSPTIVTSPRQPASKPTTLPSQPKSLPPQISPRASPRSLSTSPRSGDSITSPRSGDASPRSPRSPGIQTKPQPSPRGVKPENIELKSPVSPISSPRQQGSASLSPRTPPAVAPKPRRSPQKPEIVAPVIKSNESVQNQPIEAEVFASISGPKEDHIPSSPSGPNILPGSLTYDTVVQDSNKTDWTPGVVSSLDIKSQNSQENMSGKLDIVPDACSSNDTPSQTVTNTNSQVDVIEEMKASASEAKDVGSALKEISDSLEVKQESEMSAMKGEKQEKIEASSPDTSVLAGMTNRARSFSTSSEASSYTEFNECNVEDDLISEQIITEEEEEPVSVGTGDDNVATSEPNAVKTDADDYESDFEEGDDEEIIKPISQEIIKPISQEEVMLQPNTASECHATEPSNDGLQVLAEQIVSGVIETVKQMDLSSSTSSQEKEPEVPLSEPPILCDESPPLPESLPPLPEAGPPTLDVIHAPQDDTSIHQQIRQPSADINDNSKPVDDLTLYPDESTESTDVERDNSSTKPIASDISDTIVSPIALHAKAPNVIVDSQNTNTVTPDATVSLSVQVTDDSNEPEDDETRKNSCDRTGDQTIHEVIDMYSDIEKSNAPVNIVIQNETEVSDSNTPVNIVNQNETEITDSNAPVNIVNQHATEITDSNAPVNIVIQNATKITDVQAMSPSLVDLSDNKTDDTGIESVDADGSCDTKSLTSSDDIISDADIVESVSEISPVLNEVSQNVVDLPTDSSNLPTTDPSPTRVNGHSAHLIKNRDTPQSLDLTEPLTKQSSVDKEGSLSPRSGGSAYSPRAIDTILNEEETRGKYSPDLDRMIRMMSTSDEPEDKGEGHMTEIKITKSVTGVGFVIQGGLGSPKGDLPITIRRVFKGGPAEGLLQVGDEIHIVNGEDLSSMRRSEAWNHLKYLESGEITMAIRRF